MARNSGFTRRLLLRSVIGSGLGVGIPMALAAPAIAATGKRRLVKVEKGYRLVPDFFPEGQYVPVTLGTPFDTSSDSDLDPDLYYSELLVDRFTGNAYIYFYRVTYPDNIRTLTLDAKFIGPPSPPANPLVVTFSGDGGYASVIGVYVQNPYPNEQDVIFAIEIKNSAGDTTGYSADIRFA